MSHPKIVQTVLNLVTPTTVETPKLIYLGTASYDKEESFAIQTDGYQSTCNVISLKVSEAMDSIPSTAEIQESLGSAHIILVSGGNTLYAVNRWKELGIDVMIQRASKQGVVLCGGSAGAICWFDEGHSDSLDPTTQLTVDANLTEEQKRDWKYMRVKGLGYLPALCVPHHDATQSNGILRSVDSETMMTESPELPCVGIDEDAALVVKGDAVWVVSTNDAAKCYLKRCRSIEGKEFSIQAQAFDESHGSILLSNLWEGTF